MKKVEVQLHGASGTRSIMCEPKPDEKYKNLNTSMTPSAATGDNKRGKNTDPAADIHRKASFAGMRKLRDFLVEITEDDVWEYLKDYYGVTSRSHFYTYEWAMISASIQSATREPERLNNLIDTVLEFKNAN